MHHLTRLFKVCGKGGYTGDSTGTKPTQFHSLPTFTQNKTGKQRERFLKKKKRKKKVTLVPSKNPSKVVNVQRVNDLYTGVTEWCDDNIGMCIFETFQHLSTRTVEELDISTQVLLVMPSRERCYCSVSGRIRVKGNTKLSLDPLFEC